MKILKSCLLGITFLVLMLGSSVPDASAQVVVRVGQDNHYHHRYHHHYHHHHYHNGYNR
jgi:hypothetical protein